MAKAAKNAGTAPQTPVEEVDPEESGNYADILDRQWDDIPKAQVLPEGSWLLRSRNASFKEGKGDNSPVVLFVFAPKEPFDDVDETALSELGADYDVTSNRIFYRKYVETNADWDAVRDILGKLGVDVVGKSIRTSLKEVKGTEVIGYLKQRSFTTDSGETRVENSITNFAPVE